MIRSMPIPNNSARPNNPKAGSAALNAPAGEAPALLPPSGIDGGPEVPNSAAKRST